VAGVELVGMLMVVVVSTSAVAIATGFQFSSTCKVFPVVESLLVTVTVNLVIELRSAGSLVNGNQPEFEFH